MRISDWSSDVCSSDLKKKTTFIVSTWPELKITSDLCAAGHSITGEDKKRIGKLLQLDASLKCFSVEPIAEVEKVSIFSISRSWDEITQGAIGRAHVCTPVTNAHHVCRLLL